MKRLSQAITFLATSILALAASLPAAAEGVKDDLSYVGLAWTQVEFDRVLGHRKARTSAGTLILGTYISDYIKTEIRAGVGIDTDEINTSTTARDEFGQQPYASIGLDDYLSWYMGVLYPVTDYITVSAQYGFTRMIGKVEYPDPDQQTSLPESLTDSSFSMSYILGADFKLYDGLWGTLEYGRLHKDTITEIRTTQMSLGLKYEF